MESNTQKYNFAVQQVTLSHPLMVWEGGREGGGAAKAVLPPRDGAAWDLIQFTLFKRGKLMYEVLSELR